MKWNHTLEEVLGSKLKIRIVRTLCESARPLTGNKLAQAAGYSHTQTYKALADLETLGVVAKEYVGASHLYSINPRSYIVDQMLGPVLAAEEKMLGALASKFYERMGKDLLSITLYGSVARREDESGSDIDLVLVARDSADLESLEDVAARVSLDAALEFGGPVSAFVVSETDYHRLLSEASAMWANVKREGLTIAREDREALQVG
jgi:predicted nucleotidyltransferase